LKCEKNSGYCHFNATNYKRLKQQESTSTDRALESTNNEHTNQQTTLAQKMMKVRKKNNPRPVENFRQGW